MKILFSPSEAKSEISNLDSIDNNSFFLPEIYEKRLKVIKIYQEYINTAEDKNLEKLFGLKSEEIQKYKIDLTNSKTTKAVKRYTGVAYKHLNYDSLDETSQKFIDENVIIFSNIFGAILAKDRVPFYKLKQGEKIDKFDIAKFYKKEMTKVLDKFLEDEFIIDLRAGFYEKFYTIKSDYITMKFIKNNKVLSHFAKAYRGEVLRTIAIHQIKNKNELLDINFDGVSFKEIKEIKNKKELVFEII
jgi:hypothetical protein